MPVVLPNAPGHPPGFGTSHSSEATAFALQRVNQLTPTTLAIQNGATRFHDGMTVVDIKAKAREAVQKEAKGASALSLIRTARTQLLSAKDYETKGDLRSALGSFIKAASLAKMTMDSAEYSQEGRSKGGVLKKELTDFLSGDGRDLTERTTAVEEKLKAIEKSQPTEQSSSNGSNTRSGGSIADRLRALQDNGLAVTTNKRFLPSQPPASPISPAVRYSTASQSSPSTTHPTLVPSTPISSAPSPHTLVSPSSFGPPSPSSSPSSSPQLNNFDLTGFTQAFPSIDELDELPGFNPPSVPTGPSNNESSKSVAKDLWTGESSASPLTSFKSFTVPIERPSSTPVTPTVNNFNSRPASPTKSTVPLKPSGLSNTAASASSGPKTPIPKTNTAFPAELLSYIREHNVLIIDVRNRAEFDREHIVADAVVCIEPSILMREGVNSKMLEDAMVVAPRHEASLFGNRDKFDLVVVYDGSSESFGAANTPLSILVRVISEQAFQKVLKRMPMMLVGGFEAWKRDIGNTELRGESSYAEVKRPIPTTDVPSSLLLSSSPNNSNNPFTNGMVTAQLSGAAASSATDPHQVWTPRQRPDALPLNGADHRSNYSLDQPSGHIRSPADFSYNAPPDRSITRRPAMMRPSSVSFSRSKNEMTSSPLISPQRSLVNGTPSTSTITYPQFPRRISPTASGSGTTSATTQTQFITSSYDITSPPQASINPTLSRRRSDYVDQTQEAIQGFHRAPIDYPELTSPQIVRPPPVASSALVERQDNRPRPPPYSPSGQANGGPKAPRISSEYPVIYWPDTQVGISGLKNLGNTCYMNAPIQCLSATVPFSRFFTEGRWKTAINFTNKLGSQGKLAGAFAKLLHEMWGEDLPFVSPTDFRRSICQLKSQYNGSDQHDSQEFLSFLIDGIHEDLNRVMVKPTITQTPAQEAELERLPVQIASDREWRNWKARNDSLIVDFFQGQFRNQLECLTCHKTSTTYNVFSILQLPIPARSGKVPIDRCLNAFFNEEVLEKDDAWDCPQCKVKRRASKRLSLARLPPILLVHLKRFEANGRFSDKIDTFVDFPIKSLDLTNYMPPLLPSGADKSELNGGLPMSTSDPRTQLPPYRYDLYGVTNHYGNLSSGHYTAFIASSGGWMYCDDSSVKAVDPKQVVNQKAYVLFYKRVRS